MSSCGAPYPTGNTQDSTGKKLDYPNIDIIITLDRDGDVESTPTRHFP